MSIIDDLKKRKVIRTAIGYAIVAFVVMQIVEILFPIFNFPQWTQQFVIILLFLGFPVTVVISWMFDKTPDGVVKTVDNYKEQSFPWKISLIASILALVLYILFDNFNFTSKNNPNNQSIESLQNRTNSIAVLPFNNFSKDQSDQFFSDGLTEDIITQLSKIKKFKVISRTSVMEYKGTTKKLKEIAKELGVVNILEGSVRVVDKQIRINAQLIDAFTDEHIWAETYDRPSEDIFAVQTDVAMNIANILKTEISPEEEKSISKTPTMNVEAYNLYLKGKSEYYNYDVESMKRSIDYYNRALKIDPTYYLAYAELGNSFAQLYFRDGFDESNKEIALSYIEKALSFDPNMDVAYKAKALTHYWSGETLEGVKNDQIAISLNPSNVQALVNLSASYGNAGHIKGALEGINRAIELSPRSPLIRFYHALNLERIGDEDGALKTLKFGLEQSPGNWPCMNAMAMFYIIRKDKVTAEKHLKKLKTLRKNDNRINQTDLLFNYVFRNNNKALDAYNNINKPNDTHKIIAIYLYKQLGNLKKSTELIDELETKHSNRYQNNLGGRFSPRTLSRIYAIKGNYTEAINWLQRSIDRGERDYREFYAYPEFENMKSNPRFLNLIGLMKDLGNIEAMKIKTDI